MKLDLKIQDGRIAVQCEMPVSGDTCSFALARSMELRGVSVPYAAEDCELELRPPMVKYTFSGVRGGALRLEYGGVPEGALSYMQEEVIHFSIYNGWYPVGFDADGAFDVTVHADETYTLVNGVYDPAAGVWRWQSVDSMVPDCNILLIRRNAAHLLQSGGLNLWYFAPEHGEYARKLVDAYTEVAAFYQKLYGNSGGLAETTVVIMPPKYELGAYQREKLTVFSELREDPVGMIAHLAHELGHAYAHGADTASWEDWLNETHAEWSALLYMRSAHPDYFAAYLAEREGQDVKPLRPPDGSRPGDVHKTGTLLYCGLYRQYGAEAIADLLRAFDQLEQKDTAHFLAAVQKLHPEAARMIGKKC